MPPVVNVPAVAAAYRSGYRSFVCRSAVTYVRGIRSTETTVPDDQARGTRHRLCPCGFDDGPPSSSPRLLLVHLEADTARLVATQFD